MSLRRRRREATKSLLAAPPPATFPRYTTCLLAGKETRYSTYLFHEPLHPDSAQEEGDF